MYVHVREEQGWLYLGYWWFLRFNTSPYRPEVNCLPGLGFRKGSCFDHQGDWEGVTVVLRIKRRGPDELTLDNLEREAVHFDAHGHPVRWRWHDVERVREARDATHTVVYVAVGSHASYPAPCKEDSCTQDLAQSSLGDGGFDGKVPWAYNATDNCLAVKGADGQEDRGACLVGLPSTRDGKFGVLWNAFPGRWGAATCSTFAKACSSGDGPDSPSGQTRFRKPWTVAANGPAHALVEHRRARTATGTR